MGIVAALFVALPRCGFRERGLEVELEIASAAGSAALIEISDVTFLPCPDVPPRAALWGELWPVAMAHDTTTAMTPIEVASPSQTATSSIALRPGSYCDVRVHFGSPVTPGLAMATGTAPERETVLRLVDQTTGTPTRLTLATAPHRAHVRIALGEIEPDATPAHALSLVIDRAEACLVTP